MSEFTKQLRQAAECAPLWQHFLIKAADEIEQLQDENRLLSRVRDIFDNAEEADHALSDNELSKIKAEAVIKATYETRCSFDGIGDKWLCKVTDLVHYASKLEGGEL